MDWLKKQFQFIAIPWKINRFLTNVYILLSTLIGLLPSFYIVTYSKFIDNILNFYSKNIVFQDLIPTFWLLTILTFFQYFSENIKEYISTKLRMELLRELKIKSINKRANLKYELIENQESWDLIHRVVKGIPNEIINGFFNMLRLVQIIIKIVSIAMIIAVFAPVSAGVIILCFVPIIFVSIRSGKENYDGIVEFQKVERILDSYEDVLTSKEYADERTVFNYSSYLTEKWQRNYKKAMKLFLQIKKKSYMKVKATSITITSILLAIILILMDLHLKGTITIGILTATVIQLLDLSNTLAWGLSSIVYQLANSHNFAIDYHKFEDLENHVIRTDKIKIEEIREIQFENVRFKYPSTDQYILKDINLQLNSGNSYAIVGQNGSGKSTLLKLILNLYDNYEGKILINGIDINDVENASSLFAVAFQDYAKYEISILDNLVFGDHTDLDTPNIEDLFNKLNFPLKRDDFEEGLGTQLGFLTQKGRDLSIGQWQKIALIRAALGRRNFYLFDEPTAALDPISETAIYTDFKEILKEHSSIIITHRLGAAKIADKIIVIGDGIVKEIGSHDELLMKKGIYNQMFESQRMWYQDE